MSAAKSERRGGKQYDRPTPRWDSIAWLVERAGSAGISQSEIRERISIEPQVLWSALRSYVKREWLFAGGPHMRMRYFTRRDWAEAYVAPLTKSEMERIAIEKRKAERAARPAQERRHREARPFSSRILQPGINFPSPKHAEIEIKGLDTAPITRGRSCTHDPRYQLPPGARVVGPFGLVGIGRDVETGKPWEAA